MEGEHQRTSEDAKFENSEQPAVFESGCFLTPKQKRMMSKLYGKLAL